MAKKQRIKGGMAESNGLQVTNEAGKVADDLKNKQRKKDKQTVLEVSGRGKKKRRRGRSVVTTKQDDDLKVVRRRKKEKPK